MRNGRNAIKHKLTQPRTCVTVIVACHCHDDERLAQNPDDVEQSTAEHVPDVVGADAHSNPIHQENAQHLLEHNKSNVQDRQYR